MAIYLNFYANLDSPSNPGSDGSSGNPFGRAEFKAAIAVWYPGDGPGFDAYVTWNLRGSYDDPSDTLTLQQTGHVGSQNSTQSFVAWDLSLYGPWRFNIGGLHVYDNINPFFFNGIVFCNELKFWEVSLVFANFVIVSCFFNVVNLTANINHVPPTFKFLGSTFIVTGTWSYGNQTYSKLHFYNSVIDVAYMAVTAVKAGYLRYCQFVQASPWQTMPGITDRTGSVFGGWTAPTWPAWNAPRSGFKMGVLNAGMANPPLLGDGYWNNEYISYNTDVWGFTRTQIGASDQSPVIAPVADFTADNTHVVIGQTVNFTDLSLNTPTSWLYNFGDSTTSTLQNPSHAYGSAGLFTVDMTATNSAGSDSSTKTNYIEVVDESPYGLGAYGTGGYKCGETTNPELHYYALKKIMPYALTGDLDNDLHIEGKYLDQSYYYVGGSDPQSPYSAGGLLPEFFGDTITQLLPDWQRVFDLATSTTAVDVEAAQYLVAHKDGQLTKDNYIVVASKMGFTVTIYEGIGDMFIVGDASTLLPQPASQLPHMIYDVDHIWHWYVTVTAGPTDAVSRGIFEAKINELKPGFTQVHFTYL